MVAQEFRSGLWLKDDQSFVNVREILPDTTLLGVKIFQYDSGYHLKAVSYSDRGHYETEGRWLLENVTQTHFVGDHTTVEKLPQLAWKSVLNPDILSVLLVVPEQMSAWNLYQYVVHLRENKQKTIRYEIALWSKLAYPFATLVMMIFALPFAYHQTRSGGIGGKIFLGIMVGLSFHRLAAAVQRILPRHCLPQRCAGDDLVDGKKIAIGYRIRMIFVLASLSWRNCLSRSNKAHSTLMPDNTPGTATTKRNIA
jgi:lipopolysaccharide export system permease protein